MLELFCRSLVRIKTNKRYKNNEKINEIQMYRNFVFICIKIFSRIKFISKKINKNGGTMDRGRQ